MIYNTYYELFYYFQFFEFMVEVYLLQCKLYENYARLQRAEVFFFAFHQFEIQKKAYALEMFAKTS